MSRGSRIGMEIARFPFRSKFIGPPQSAGCAGKGVPPFLLGVAEGRGVPG